MSGPGFTVDTAALERYARDLEGAADRLAHGAPGPAALSADAFGLVGRLVAGTATEAAGRGVAALVAATARLRARAGAARETAAAYERADLGAALGLERAARSTVASRSGPGSAAPGPGSPAAAPTRSGS